MEGPVRERILTPALTVFLLAVAAVVAGAVATRNPAPDLEGCIELLADGDLDREERRRVLARAAQLGGAAASARGRAAGCLASLALQDRTGFEAGRGALASALPLDQRRWLGLGDPLLANVLAASMSGVAGDRGEASLRWGQVAAQARMTGNKLAADIAARELAQK